MSERQIKTVGIIGAGTMGSDIALDLSINAYMVVLKDVNDHALEHAKEAIKKNLSMIKMMKPELRAISFETVLSRIKFCTDYSEIRHVDLIIENIFEDLSLKKQLYLELARECGPDTIFAINTSC